MDSGAIIAIIVPCAIFIIGMVVISICIAVNHENANRNIIAAGQSLRIGMSKDNVMSMLGPDYTKSVLASGEEKYEWRVRNGGYSVGYKGTGVRSYVPSTTRRLSVYFKNDRVSRYSGLNLN